MAVLKLNSCFISFNVILFDFKRFHHMFIEVEQPMKVGAVMKMSGFSKVPFSVLTQEQYRS